MQLRLVEIVYSKLSVLVITNLFQSKCYRMYHISYLSLPLELKSCDQHNFSQNELIYHNAKGAQVEFIALSAGKEPQCRLPRNIQILSSW